MIEEIYIEFFALVDKRMDERDLTQDDVARKLGVTRAAVSSWHRRTTRIAFDHAVALASILDIDLNQFKGGFIPAAWKRIGAS